MPSEPTASTSLTAVFPTFIPKLPISSATPTPVFNALFTSFTINVLPAPFFFLVLLFFCVRFPPLQPFILYYNKYFKIFLIILQKTF